MINIIEVESGSDVREIKEVTYEGDTLTHLEELTDYLFWDDLYAFIDGNNELVIHDTNAGRFYYVWEWNQYSFKDPHVKIMDLLNNKKSIGFDLVSDPDTHEELSDYWEGA